MSSTSVYLFYGYVFSWLSTAMAFYSPKVLLRPSSVSWTTTSRHVTTLPTSETLNSIKSWMTGVPEFSSSTLLLTATEPWVQPTADFLGPFLNFLSFAMLARVVLSWYPNTKKSDFPWILVTVPTEPLLRAIQGIVPPAFGVDITPIVWLGFFTFVNEILLGQQGLLTMKLKYGI